MTEPVAEEMLGMLARLDRQALAERWGKVFGRPAPRQAQATLLRNALAWHWQMVQKAGTAAAAPSIRRLQRSLARSAPAPLITPGTRLLREWQGQTHQVTVLTQGFDYQGKTYRSLTAISRQITGTAWSGPLFFGLRS